MRIGAFDTARRPLLIAEIGNNHEGDAVLAHELAAAAIEAGAHAVKFQIIDPARLVHHAQTDRIAQLTRYRLPLATFAEIAATVTSRGRLFMASAFDMDSLSAIAPHLDAVKIASGDLDFDPLLAQAAALGKPIVLSTGMSTTAEIAHAVDVISAGLPPADRLSDRLALLHCVSLYPTPLACANLRAIPALAERFGLTVGYSDHTLGIEASIAALALGARVIEKHFTLNKSQSSFRDHALSADPVEFAQLARLVEASDAMAGNGARDEVGADAGTRAAARRSVVAARDLAAGSLLQSNDFDYLRPATGVSPSHASQLTGRRLKVARARHDLIELSNVE